MIQKNVNEYSVSDASMHFLFKVKKYVNIYGISKSKENPDEKYSN